MSIRATRGTRLLLAAAIAWLGLALCAQAAHATYAKVQVAKVNQGGNPADTFGFHPTLTPSMGDFSLKGGDSSTAYQVECNVDRPGKAGECQRWGYPTLKFAEIQKPGYTLTDITCRYTQGTSGWPSAPTSASPIKPASEVVKDLAAGTVSLKVHWYEWVKCTYTNTKQPDTGTIKVIKKVVAPAGDTGKFNLLIDGQAKATNVGDGGTTGVQTVNAGNHTVGESAGAGTSLADYDSSLSCVDKAHGGAPDTDGAVQVDKGDAWECTFTNTRKIPQPPTPPTPPTTPQPPVQPPVTPQPPVQQSAPQIAVSPTKVRPGSAKLRGPSGCPRTNVVRAAVSGKRIVKVTFYLDGKKVKTLTRPNKGGQWVLPLNVRRMAYGTHRVRARIEFANSSGTKTKTLRLSFSRCGATDAQPQFTG